MNKIPLVVGTIAFDRLLSVVPSIAREIELNTSISGSINLNFVANQPVVTRRGGTAGNISYTLGLLGKKPVMFSVAGRDFIEEGYEVFLKNNGVTIAVEVFVEEESACCYQISDENEDQITIWQSNAYDNIDKTGLSAKVRELAASIGVAIFSTGNPIGTIKQMKEISELNPDVLAIFDPGQRLMSYSKSQFKIGLETCDVLTVNEQEFQKTISMGFTRDELLDDFVECIIVTLGSKGSRVITGDKTVYIDPAVPSRVIETTGAGDAFRAGLIAGLLDGKDYPAAARIGSSVASFCIENTGAQSHKIIWEDIEKRLPREKGKN